VWGNEAERVKAETMAMQSAYIQVMPALDLNSLKALIAKADLVIGNDTGPTHIAWGLNKPSITLFGCTPISRVYQTDINKVLKSSSLVNPYKLNKQDYSINEIETQAVVNLVQNLFAL
jgi:heptosyltransferase-1